MSNPNEEARWDKNSREIQAKAAVWIEERESEDWSDARQAEFDAWVGQSPAHLVAFLRADAVWKRADRFRALGRPGGPMKPDSSGGSASKTPFLKIAAALVVISLAATGAFTLFQGPKAQTYSTTIGGRETLTLDDGSQIELNTNTSVRVAYGANQRNVWLDKGEAYFRITHDPAHPFMVTLGDKRVTDLGTKFLIRRNSDQVEVALLEGKARFEDAVGSPHSRQATLMPGDVVTATENSMSLTRKSTQTMANELAWRSGMLVFDHAMLIDIAKEYNRYNRTKLVIADAATAHLTISGTLPATEIGAFTRVATKFFNLRAEKRKGEIVISR